MFGKKTALCLPLFLLTLLAGCTDTGKACTTSENCEKDADCRCWCSQKCGFRKKKESDRPVYIENDPNGKSCYCKQWDVDNYEENCLLKKGIKQPKDAE